MKLYIKLFFVLITLVTLSSCRGLKLDGDIDKLIRSDSIPVVQFVVSPPYQPTFPLIDAALYNSDVEDIIPNILDTNIVKANELAEFTLEFFRDSTTLILLTGKEYYNSEEYRKLSTNVKTYNLELEDEDLFEFAIPDGSKNFFNMYEGLPLGYFGRHSSEEKPNKTIKKIAEELDREIIAIIITGNLPGSPGFFSSKWSTTNIVQMFFYNKNGTLLASINNESPPYRVSGNDQEGYGKLLDLYKKSISKIAKELKIRKR